METTKTRSTEELRKELATHVVAILKLPMGTKGAIQLNAGLSKCYDDDDLRMVMDPYDHDWCLVVHNSDELQDTLREIYRTRDAAKP